jgi:RNA polymerase sigma-70 factor (ECF subfamily)
VDAERESLERTYREEATRIRAALAARTGDVGLAEDAVQEAFLAAIEHWPREGVPANPGGWLATTARRKVVDRLRRDKVGADKLALAAATDEGASPGAGPGEADRQADDELLSLAFACCHPALAIDAQVALTLRAVVGLTSGQIAAAFLVSEPTMAQRLLRARKTLSALRAPVAIPDPDELAGRLAQVLAVAYLVFNEGYLASSGREPARRDLAAQAVALTRTLHRLMPREPEVLGLLALLLLHESRAKARFDGWGRLIRLKDQDRGQWDKRLADEAAGYLDRAIALRRPGPYQVQAAIAALHAQAPSYQETDWRQIRLLYTRLQQLAPSPVVLLNRAVATRYAISAQQALAEVEPLAPDLGEYHLFHALRAALLAALGRDAEADQVRERALALAANPAERELLTHGLALLARGRPPDPGVKPGISAHLEDRADLDRDPPAVDAWPGLRDVDGLVDRVGLDQRVAAEHLLGLDERPVGHPGGPHRLRRRGLLELVPGLQAPGRSPLLVPGADLRVPAPVLGAVRARLVLGVQDQQHVLHASLLLVMGAPCGPLHRVHEWRAPRSDIPAKVAAKFSAPVTAGSCATPGAVPTSPRRPPPPSCR